MWTNAQIDNLTVNFISGILLITELGGGLEGGDEDEKQEHCSVPCEDTGQGQPRAVDIGGVLPQETQHIYRKQNRNGRKTWINLIFFIILWGMNTHIFYEIRIGNFHISVLVFDIFRPSWTL